MDDQNIVSVQTREFSFISRHKYPKIGQPNEYAHGFEPVQFDGSVICQRAWSPCLFSEGIRLEKNFCSADVAALDFDNGLSLADGIQLFSKFKHCIGTTKSHGLKGDRFRVILFFDSTITNLAIYKSTMTHLIYTYKADRACKDGARFFYPCKDVVSVGDGEIIKPITLQVVPNVRLPPREQISSQLFVVDKPAPIGRRNQITFAACCNFLRLGLDESTIFGRLRIISNGLSEEEIQKIFNSAITKK